MAANGYPQIPQTVWWGVRKFIQKSPTTSITSDLIAADLGVQSNAASAYLRELTKIGILDSENKPTSTALKWRLDDEYDEAVSELLSNIYPDDLLSLCPPGSIDRVKAKRWFEKQGLGSGSAGNKAATYALIGGPLPGTGDAVPAKSETSRRQRQRPPTTKGDVKTDQSTGKSEGPASSPTLNLNFQIHISADASPEQIELIFENMQKYFGK
ncbi:MAG: DUF5343 domain-containing protein [Pseudomonadota bacterium]